MRFVGLFSWACMAAWFGAAGSAVATVPADVLIRGGTVSCSSGQGTGTNLVPYVGFGAVRKQVQHERSCPQQRRTQRDAQARRGI